MTGALALALAWQGAFHLDNTAGALAALAPTMAASGWARRSGIR
jgi:hypothetical protein